MPLVALSMSTADRRRVQILGKDPFFGQVGSVVSWEHTGSDDQCPGSCLDLTELRRTV